MMSEPQKESIIQDICQFIGASSPPAFLVENAWIELDSGIWVLPKPMKAFMEDEDNSVDLKKIKYAGIFLGKIRRNFGLSMETLYFLQPFITRYCIIKGKPLQKYLYGKSAIIEVPKHTLSNLELQKLIIMTPEKEPVGISSFRIVDEEVRQGEVLMHVKLDPITDLGMFLRNERTMFE